MNQKLLICFIIIIIVIFIISNNSELFTEVPNMNSNHLLHLKYKGETYDLITFYQLNPQLKIDLINSISAIEDGLLLNIMLTEYDIIKKLVNNKDLILPSNDIIFAIKSTELNNPNTTSSRIAFSQTNEPLYSLNTTQEASNYVSKNKVLDINNNTLVSAKTTNLSNIIIENNKINGKYIELIENIFNNNHFFIIKLVDTDKGVTIEHKNI